MQSGGLVLSDISAGYGDTIVLSRISLTLLPGATLAVLGRNGVGKTTLLTTVMGHTQLHDGSIRFESRDISTLAIYQRAALGLALVPQEREIFRSLIDRH
jgi:branched-chain amino acid transport system ATP-binding protein